MIELTDTTYHSFIEKFFQENPGHPLVVFYGSPSCDGCKKTLENYHSFVKSMEGKQTVEFAFMNYTINHVMDRDYGEFYNMYEYPKTVIFNGSLEDKEFMQGVVTLDKMLEIQKNVKV
jgi:thiol-disulfide isomerase/thioredoxin